MATEPGRARQAGFTLVEALVALVVAGIVLAVFGRAMAGAWASAKTPMDVISGIGLARSAALGAPAGAFAGATLRGFTIDRTSGAVEIVQRASHLAPPLQESPAQPPKEAKATPAAMQLAEPTGIVERAAGAPPPELKRVSVVVATPMGRHLSFDIVRLVNAAP